MKRRDFDVIVIGAGHAGVEAAWAAAQVGRTVGVCTLSNGTVAHMQPGDWRYREGSSRA